MFRAFWKLAQFRNCVAQIGGCQFACQFRNCVRDFETAQREFLLKLEMVVYIIAAMVASSKHTFTPTKLACEGHADASIDTHTSYSGIVERSSQALLLVTLMVTVVKQMPHRVLAKQHGMNRELVLSMCYREIL